MPDLLTERLALSPLIEEDAPAVFRLHNDARTWRHFPMGRWTDPRQGEAFVRMSRGSFARTGLGEYAVRLRGEGPLAGGVGVFAMAGPEDGAMGVVRDPPGEGEPAIPPHALLNIGWRMAPEAWGRGLASEAAGAVAARAHEIWPSLALTACVLSTNPASAAVCGHLGLSLRWSGLSGEALRVRAWRPRVPGGESCVRWFFADRDVAPALVAARVRGL
ncbi:GNAT family N-acetyltransferase [Schaalia naturae]|uniref:GNAT family N-acetyltransferase n=1 Tax=Schaalia naturae TaxID=635203 RepID=A0ABW2SJS6_9ACTO